MNVVDRTKPYVKQFEREQGIVYVIYVACHWSGSMRIQQRANTRLQVTD